MGVIFSILFSVNVYAIIGGQKLVGYSDLVRLDFENGNICTGVYLDPYTILTAAHCLSASPIKGIISSNDQRIEVAVTKNLVHPKYSHQLWPRFDLGLVKTKQNEKFQGQFKFLSPPLDLSGSGKILGCGIVQFAPKLRERSFGEIKYYQVGSVLMTFGSPSIAPNDSGGPIVDSENKILGVSSKTTRVEDGWMPSIGFASSLATEEAYQFISSNLGEITESPELPKVDLSY